MAGAPRRLATVEFVPPRELTASQGGVLLAEAVRPEHKVAWLIGAAVDGYLDLEGDDGQVTLIRLPRRDGPAPNPLDSAFEGRDRLTLGSYDEDFASAWGSLGRELAAWERTSGLWDPAGDHRRARVRALGVVAAAAVTRALELRVRTPAGSGLWLRTESFRRFLAGSEAHHAEEAARLGHLREYTA